VNARLGRGMRMLLPVLTAFALTLAAVAASAEPDRPLSVRAPRAASAVGQASVTACNPKASSLRPSGPLQVTPGSFMEKIRARGYLIAGVDQNTYHFGYFNPANGQIEGFDIDMIKAVARYIGVTKVEYKAISDDQRIPDVENGAVDIVAHTMTILCDRLKYVDFSSVYFDAGPGRPGRSEGVRYHRIRLARSHHRGQGHTGPRAVLDRLPGAAAAGRCGRDLHRRHYPGRLEGSGSVDHAGRVPAQR